MYRLMHDDDEAGGAEGGSFGIHGVAGDEPSRCGSGESRNRRTGAEDRGGAGVPSQSAGQQPAYQQDPYPGLHQRGGRHNPVRRRHHPGSAGRGQPIGIHHAHRQHRRRVRRGYGDRRAEALRRGRFHVRQDVEPHHACAGCPEGRPGGAGGRHRCGRPDSQCGTGRDHDRQGRHQPADPCRLPAHRLHRVQRADDRAGPA